MRYLIALSCLLYVSCGPPEAVAIQEVQQLSGQLTYRQDIDRLELALQLTDSTTRPPLFHRTLMVPRRGLPARQFSSERRFTEPDSLVLEVPELEGSAEFVLPLPLVAIDSLPDTIRQVEGVQLAVADEGLGENESLTVVLRPREPGEAKRILLAGPTRRGAITLSASSLADLLPGSYAVYLIRQQRWRDQQRNTRLELLSEYLTAPRTVVIE